MYKYILLLHVLAATVWTGGHLVLCLAFLPKALKSSDPQIISGFESRYEPFGMAALVIQVVTGFWLAHELVPNVGDWFSLASETSGLILMKIILLVGTFSLAIHARMRIIPRLTEKNLKTLAWHIVLVTVISVLFVVTGVGFRTGELF